MPHPKTRLMGIARDFLAGNITAFDIRTNTLRYSNRTRGIVTLTVLTHYGVLEFNRHKTKLTPIIEALFPVVFRKDGRCFNNEFPIYDGGSLDPRLVSFNPASIIGFLHRAKLSSTSGGRGAKATITLLPPIGLQRLITDHSEQPRAIVDFVQSGRNVEELLEQARP